MSDLRTRIAQIIGREIHGDDPDEPCQWCFHFADVFIEDLRLSATSGVIVGCLHEDADG